MSEEYRKDRDQERDEAMMEPNKEEGSWSGRTMSRRRLLTAIGAAGAALTTMSVLAGQVGEAAKGEKPSVSSSVYGQSEHPLTGDCVLAVTIGELRAEQSPEAGRLYYVTDPGQEGPFMYDAADTVTPDNTGTVLVSAAGARFKRRYDGNIHAGWFGAKGDGATDDTSAVRAALAAARGKTLFFPPGVFIADRYDYGSPQYVRPWLGQLVLVCVRAAPQ